MSMQIKSDLFYEMALISILHGHPKYGHFFEWSKAIEKLSKSD